MDGFIYRLCGEKKARLFSLFENGLKEWEHDDYSVPVFDCWHWNMNLQSGNKTIRKLEGTIEPTPLGQEIQKIIQQIAGDEMTYIF